jgi:hypothetical protein
LPYRNRRKKVPKKIGKPVDDTPPTSRERVVWFLELLERDAASLRPGDWLNLRHDVQRFLWPGMDLGLPTFEDLVRELLETVKTGLEQLKADRRWDFRPPLEDRVTHLQEQRDKSLFPARPRRDPRAALLAAVVDLVVEWWPSMRRCRRCSSWFVPRHGRQLFHTAACAAQARWRRFAPKRKRDYHAEYAQRLRRVVPGAKPQRRPREGTR